MYGLVDVPYIVCAETLRIIYRCGQPRKRVSLNLQFCQKKVLDAFYLIFDCCLFLTAIFDDFKNVGLELNNDTQFCSVCCRIIQIGQS